MLKNIETLFNKPDVGLLWIRITLGSMMIAHGIPKFLDWKTAMEKVGGAMNQVYGLTFLPPEVWGFMAATSEVLGGSLVVLGLLFRPASFFLSFTMLTAFLLRMKQSGGFENYTEYAYPLALFCVYSALLFVGPGKYAFDKSGGGGASPRKKSSSD